MENVIYCKTSEQLRTVARLNLKSPSYTTEMDHETPSTKVCCLHIFFLKFFYKSKLQRRDVATGIANVGHSFRFLIYKHTENVVNF